MSIALAEMPRRAPALRQVSIAQGDCRPDLDDAAHRADHAGKLQQQPIAGRLNDPAAMLGDLRIDEFRAQPLEPAERALLVGPDEPAMVGSHRRLRLPPASGSRAAPSREFTDNHWQPI